VLLAFFTGLFWKLFLGNIFLLFLHNFFFPFFFFFFFFFFSRFLCEASRQSFYVSERSSVFVRTFLFLVRTSALVRYLTWHYVRTALVIRSDGEPLRVKSYTPLRRTTYFSSLLTFSLSLFAVFFALFTCFSHVHLSFCVFSPPKICFSTLLLTFF
jgi:hypothetical protein